LSKIDITNLYDKAKGEREKCRSVDNPVHIIFLINCGRNLDINEFNNNALIQLLN